MHNKTVTLSADDPHENMPVEDDVSELEILLVSVLVGEGGLELPLAFQGELLHLYLLCEIDPVLGHPLVDGFLCAPVYGELLVLRVVVEVFYLLLREGLLLHG